MESLATRRSLWERMVWANCVNEDDKAELGGQAIPYESTVWWYKIEVTAQAILAALMLLPGQLSFGLVWFIAFIFMRAWTVRSTRQSHTEQMNHIIYEPQHLMQVMLFAIPWEVAISWLLACIAIYIGNLY